VTTPAARRRTALSSEAVAVVTKLVTDADVPTAAAAVADAARTSDALHAMIEHLTVHPDALWSGRSDVPNSIIKLAHALHDRGIADVVLPGCVVCSRTAREMRRVDGTGRVCQGCYLDSRRRACTRCGTVARIVSSKDGESICSACYLRDPDRHEPCAGCGKPRRVAYRDEHGHPRCVRCYPRPTRQCSTCGQVAETTAFTDAGPVCPRCYSASVKPKRECGLCGRVRSISRRATDRTPDLCYSCDPGPQDTCSGCGRHTTRAGYQGGLPVCPRCYQRPVDRCDFCGELGRITARWPSGAVCSACYPRVRATPRTCPGCAQSRTLNAINDHGEPVCAECAGSGSSYLCARCGGASDGYVRDRCAPCALRDRLDVLLSTGDGAIHPALRGVHAALSEWRNPRSVLTWLDRSDGATMLADLAQSNGGISHHDLDRYPRSRVSNYLRQALVHAGALPRRDEHIEQVEAWLEAFLRERPPAHSQLLRPFASWVVLRRARQRSRRRPTTEATASWARQRIRTAADLLRHLDDHGFELGSLDQRTLDEWLAAGRSTRHTVRDFILWAAKQRLAPRLTVPHRQAIGPQQPLAEDDRWQQLRRCIRDTEMPLRLRVAGSLVLLYGHPISRIAAMRTHHVDQNGDGVYLVVGQHHALLPPALGTLIVQLRDSAPPASIFGASASTSDWLFPGLVPGQHVADNYLVKLLNGVGIHTRTARNSALISLAADLPAPVLADLLGLHINTAVRWVRRSKRDWATYLEARAEQLSPIPAGSPPLP
jgi:hypothetical protein